MKLDRDLRLGAIGLLVITALNLAMGVYNAWTGQWLIAIPSFVWTASGLLYLLLAVPAMQRTREEVRKR